MLTIIPESSIDQVILDANALSIKSIVLDTQQLQFTLQQEKEKIHIILPQQIAEEFTLTMEYAGEINDKLVGLYRSKYDIDGIEEYAAVTQFQESDARRTFPGFDTPGKKATFDIVFIIPKQYEGISNQPIIEEQDLGEKKRIKFKTTPIMSTYLLFFAIGKFSSITADMKGRIARLVATPGRAEKYGKFGLDIGIKSVLYGEEYFDIPYPLEKLDFIATPAFAHGAMENWGAILFRENLLLHFPGITNKRQETRIEEVVAHEVTHQWFGNLVTPSTWKYLWLNEAFATYFAYKIIDHYYPEKKIWEEFVQTETVGALAADGRVNTASIEVPGEAAVGLTVITGPILYNKGGSVLRQIEGYLGYEKFRDGLRYYLQKFAYGTAASDDLWNSLEEVSGIPVNDLMQSWVLQKGYPVISVTRNDDVITLQQQRFTYLNIEDDTLWLVPLTLRYYNAHGEYETTRFLLETREAELELPDDVIAVKLNLEHTGFYRVKYTEKNLQALLNQDMSAIDRWNLENDMFAFVRAKQLTPEDYLTFISNYNNETSHLLIRSISDHLYNLYTVFTDARREQIKQIGKEFLEAVLDRISYKPIADENPGIAMVRGELIRNAVYFGSKIAQERAMQMFTHIKNGEQISADLLGPILQIGAYVNNDFEWFKQQYESAENEQEKINFTIALGSFTDLTAIEEYQTYIFEHIPMRNQGTAIATLCRNVAAKDTMWHFYLANLDGFGALFPYMHQNVIVALIAINEQHQIDMQQHFEQQIKKTPYLKDAVAIGFEYLQIFENMRS